MAEIIKKGLLYLYCEFETSVPFLTDFTGTDPGGWMRWLATHHELNSFVFFSQNCFQIQSQEVQYFPGAFSQTPSMLYMLSVIHKLCNYDAN